MNGIQSRGLTPVENIGDGNCVFISLAQIILGDPAKFEFMRYLIVHRLRNFPLKYQGKQINKFSHYCDQMAMNRTAATELELQVIADICFAVVVCYSTDDFFLPLKTIRPLRFSTMSECKSRINLWVQDGHCMALVNRQSQPLIRNIFDDSDISRRQEEPPEERISRSQDEPPEERKSMSEAGNESCGNN